MENKDEKIWKKWWFWGIILLIFILCNVNQNTSDDIEKNNDLNLSNEIKEENIKYADDEVINEFITQFKKISNYELTNIERGNIRTKYFVNINGQYCQLLNATDSSAEYFEIIIYGGNKEDDVDKIAKVYKEIIKTLDSRITDNEIDSTIINNINSRATTTSFEINDDIKVFFSPSVSLSWGMTDCEIEIKTTIYN